jgi:hypothetical protein
VFLLFNIPAAEITVSTFDVRDKTFIKNIYTQDIYKMQQYLEHKKKGYKLRHVYEYITSTL